MLLLTCSSVIRPTENIGLLHDTLIRLYCLSFASVISRSVLVNPLLRSFHPFEAASCHFAPTFWRTYRNLSSTFEGSTRGADKSLALWRRQQATGLKKCIYSTYSPLSSTHLWLRCYNFFNTSKKNSFGWAANKKSQRLISISLKRPNHPNFPVSTSDIRSRFHIAHHKHDDWARPLSYLYFSSFPVIFVAKAGIESGTFWTLKAQNNKMFAGIKITRWREVRQTGHVACIGEIINICTMYVGGPEKKRLTGRPRRRWDMKY
jgi:hypothetical protein